MGVLSNKADAYGLVRAQHAGIATTVINHKDFANRDAFDVAMQQHIDVWQPDVVVLAGFMRASRPAVCCAAVWPCNIKWLMIGNGDRL